LLTFLQTTAERTLKKGKQIGQHLTEF